MPASHARMPIGPGLLALAALAGLVSAPVAAAQTQPAARPANEALQADPDAALRALLEGNQRFIEGRPLRPRQDPESVKAAEAGQKPFAIIVGCSDSRVPNEIVFDQGVGDLFIVRTAGQVSTYASWGSIEFAHAVLGANLIVVLGHTQCGAVAAAVKLPETPGHIVTLVNEIKPAAERAAALPGDHVENAVLENVRMQAKKLASLEPILAKSVRAGKLKIVGAVYELGTGKVRVAE